MEALALAGTHKVRGALMCTGIRGRFLGNGFGQGLEARVFAFWVGDLFRVSDKAGN